MIGMGREMKKEKQERGREKGAFQFCNKISFLRILTYIHRSNIEVAFTVQG